MNKKELQEKAVILETENHDLLEKLGQAAEQQLRMGFGLIDDPFIPEYLGFTYTEARDPETDVVTGRIYTKEGFNMAKPVNHIGTNKNEHTWIILLPGNKSVEVIIENMYNAIVVLRAHGMDISVESYFEYNNNLEELMDKKFQLEEEKYLKELEKLDPTKKD